MTRTISSPELKSNLECILRTIGEERGPYVIKANGKPTAVLLSAKEYDEMRTGGRGAWSRSWESSTLTETPMTSTNR